MSFLYFADAHGDVKGTLSDPLFLSIPCEYTEGSKVSLSSVG